MKNDLPVLTKRISQIVQYYTNGNVKAFAEKLSNISQQRLDRIFKIDKRTGKYPSVPDDVLVEISKYFPDVNPAWLLTGEGEMLNNQSMLQEPAVEYHSLIAEKEKIIEWLNRELKDKRDIICHLIEESKQKNGEINKLKSELSMLKEETKKKEPSLGK
jgi:hypothetical protein